MVDSLKIILLVFFSFSIILYSFYSDSPVERRPNIILIHVDALRPDHLGFNGYPRNTSPNIDALARESIVFTNAYCVWPHTSPSVASMMTSLYPSDTEVYGGISPLKKGVDTLPGILRDMDYRTVGFVSNANLDKTFNFDQGFEEYHEVWRKRADGSRDRWIGYDAKTVTNDILFWLNWFDSEPFFLWAFYIDPHGPYTPPTPYDTMFENDILYNQTVDKLRPKDIRRFELYNSTSLNLYLQRYDGEIRYTDYWIGELLTKLKEKGYYDNSIIILTSDHGEAIGEDGRYMQHGKSIHEPQVRVPLLIRIPGERRQTIRNPVSQIDLTPTILDLAGINTPPNLAGKSLTPLLDGEADYWPITRYCGDDRWGHEDSQGFIEWENSSGKPVN